MGNIIEQLEAEQMTREVPEFSPGDTVVVQVKVKDGERERLQAFEGVVIAKRNRGLNSSFTVRKISYGEGVERVFQTYSQAIADIVVKRRGVVRQATNKRPSLLAEQPWHLLLHPVAAQTASPSQDHLHRGDHQRSCAHLRYNLLGYRLTNLVVHCPPPAP